MKKDNLNIALFSPSQNPYSETFVQAHKQYLKGRVFYYYGAVSTMKLEGEKKLLQNKFVRLGFKIYANIFKKSSSYVWEASIIKSLKRQHIDVVLVEYGTHTFNLRHILKRSNLPVVVHFHGHDASRIKTIKACNNYKEVFQLARKVISVSSVMHQRLLDMGCPKHKLVYNVCGPELDFQLLEPKFLKKQFVAIGRFTDKKAPYYTILAFKNVLKKHPNAKLLMAGDGHLVNVCKNLITYHQLDNNVKLLGVITPETYRDLLEESLAFVQHSITAEDGDTEGTPVSILEASAAGIPVISTYHAGIPDVIKHEETGLLVKEHDVKTMSEYMIRVIEDAAYAKKMGLEGKANIRNNFSLKRHIDKLQDILETAI